MLSAIRLIYSGQSRVLGWKVHPSSSWTRIFYSHKKRTRGITSQGQTVGTSRDSDCKNNKRVPRAVAPSSPRAVSFLAAIARCTIRGPSTRESSSARDVSNHFRWSAHGGVEELDSRLYYHFDHLWHLRRTVGLKGNFACCSFSNRNFMSLWEKEHCSKSDVRLGWVVNLEIEWYSTDPFRFDFLWITGHLHYRPSFNFLRLRSEFRFKSALRLVFAIWLEHNLLKCCKLFSLSKNAKKSIFEFSKNWSGSLIR